MSVIDDIKGALAAMLPSAQRIKIAKHREVNDKLLDYMFIPFGVPFPYLGKGLQEGGLNTYVPSNCHKCDGSIIQISEAPYLFEEIGTLYGGDGITTFGLPLIPPGSSLIQMGTSGQYKFEFGKTGGEVTHKLTSQESGLPAHDIGTRVRSSTGTEGGLEGIVPKNSTTNLLSLLGQDAELSHNNMPPFLVCNWIIRLR